MFTIHAHPTLAEAMLDGFGAVEGMAINVLAASCQQESRARRKLGLALHSMACLLPKSVRFFERTL